MRKIVAISIILFSVVSATAKVVTLQVTGVEPLTLTIPEEWDAYVEQVKGRDDAPEAPREMIFVGPPMNRGPFKVGDDIPEDQPYMSIYPQSHFFETSEIMHRFRFMKLPFHADNGDQLYIIEEIHDSSGAVSGYYEIRQEEGKTAFSADMNMSGRTWTATARYPAANNQFSEMLIAVIHSINSDPVLNQSGLDHILAIHDSPSMDSHMSPSTNSAQSTEKKLSKITCPRCKGKEGAISECSLCGKRGYIWVESSSE